MTSIQKWWAGRSTLERYTVGILGGILAVATGGAVVYAIASGGAVIVAGETMVAVGAAASALARARR